ncbi:MAG TPA: helix-turn-helix domain-containing protein [Acidimicrobiales bacterium]|nr:helix-turn-helix domain-containing protein [Acidimicrobiales bacterium]
MSTEPSASGGRARRGRPPAQSSEDTYKRILTAARRCFSRQGYERTAIADIAREAGVTPRALYHYVDSKRDLFLAAAEAALRRFGAEVTERVLVHDSALDRLRAYIDVFRVLHREDPSLVAFVSLSSLEARWNPDLPDPVSEVTDMVLMANRFLIDQAVERDELGKGIDPSGAVALLEVFGAGLTLMAGGERDEDYPAMLDVLERLLDGTLFVPPAP